MLTAGFPSDPLPAGRDSAGPRGRVAVARLALRQPRGFTFGTLTAVARQQECKLHCSTWWWWFCGLGFCFVLFFLNWVKKKVLKSVNFCTGNKMFLQILMLKLQNKCHAAYFS